MHVMTHFVCKDSFDLVLREVVHKRVGKDDSPGPPNSCESGICLLGILAQVEGENAVDRDPRGPAKPEDTLFERSSPSGTNL